MAKFNTCEEYVLNELAEAREEIKLDNDIIRMMKDIISFQHKICGILKENLEVRKTSDGKEVISMDLIFEEFDKADFDLIKGYFFGDEEGEEEEKDDD